MTEAGHLWAVAFDDVSRADRVCGEIIKLAERHRLILLDWTVAVRFIDGSFTVDGEPLFASQPARPLGELPGKPRLGGASANRCGRRCFYRWHPDRRLHRRRFHSGSQRHSCSRALRSCSLLTEQRT